MDVMEEEGRKSKGLAGLLELLRRRKWLGILTCSGVVATVVSLALFLPNIFISRATVLIERQQIPAELVRSTVTGDLEIRLHTISQEILSRSRLQGLIERFGLYPDLKGRVPAERLLEQMREDIKLELKGDERRSGDVTTVAFTLSYRGRDPQKVAAVANTLASFYIEENLKVRERQAAGTADFLQSQLEEMKQKLEQQEKQVGRFKESHIGELPQQTDANLATLEGLNAQLRLNSDSQIKINERRHVLAAQLAAAEASQSPAGPNAAAVRLELLNKQLAELQTHYSDKYPDVIRVKAEIAALEKDLRASKGERSRVLIETPQVLQLKQTIADVDVEYKALRAEADSLRASIARYQRRVENSPRREQEYHSLARDYETTREIYQSLLRRQREAEVGESMEQRQKGETFRVIEPAIASEEPAAPNRLQLILIGLMIAFGLAAGAVMVAEYVDTSFHSVEDLREGLPVPVLVSIPRIVTHRDRRSRRWRLALGAVSAMVGITLLVGSSYLMAQRSDVVMSLLLRE